MSRNYAIRPAVSTPEIIISESEYARAKDIATHWVLEMGQAAALELAKQQVRSDFWTIVIYIIDRDLIVKPLAPRPVQIHVVSSHQTFFSTEEKSKVRP